MQSSGIILKARICLPLSEYRASRTFLLVQLLYCKHPRWDLTPKFPTVFIAILYKHTTLAIYPRSDKMMYFKHSPAIPAIAVLTCLYPTTCIAAALRNPDTQTLTQTNNPALAGARDCFLNAPPSVALPKDKAGNNYVTSTGLNCLDDGSPHEAECWSVLELDEWLPQWFLHTPQCAQNASSEMDCNKQDPPEPWTTTFMRMTMRGGDWNGCSDAWSTNCQWSPDSCPSLGSSPASLLRARYKYVAYTISSMYRPLPSTSSISLL